MYKAHLFICTNGAGAGPDGKGVPGKCGIKNAEKLWQTVKAGAREHSWAADVRVNKSGCLGQCERGIACVIYPQNEWHLDQNENSAETLLKALEEKLG